MKLNINTPILELPSYNFTNLSPAMARKLALAVAGFAYKNDLSEAIDENPLLYMFNSFNIPQLNPIRIDL